MLPLLDTAYGVAHLMKLRVGDIEMDSEDGISFGGSQNQARTQQRLPQPTARSTTTETPEQHLQRLTLGLRLCLAGLALTGLAIPGALIAAWLLEVTALLAVAPTALLVASGVGVLIFHLQIQQLKSQPQPEAATIAQGSPLMQERARRLRSIIEQSTTGMLVKDIVAEVRWSDAVILETLDFMVDHALLIEELDDKNDAWRYRICGPIGRHDLEDKEDHLPVSERLRLARARQKSLN